MPSSTEVPAGERGAEASANGRTQPRPAHQVLSPQDLGRTNRFRVLQALVDHGPLSRADLARKLGVPRASVGAITKALVEGGVLQEDKASDQPRQGRGKPPRPLWFADSAGLTGAITIESERVSAGVVNARGVAADVVSVPIASTIGVDELLECVTGLARQVLLPQAERLVATGVTVPAQVDSVRGEIELCTIVPALTGSPLVRRLDALTGGPVWLEQDVRALASAERWFGRGRGTDGFAVLEIDLGVGVGIVVEGHLFPGAAVSSPQVGHTCVDRDGQLCSCGAVGCWETIASLAWLRTQAAARGLDDHVSKGSGAGGSSMLPADLVALAENGDDAAEALLAEFAENLALGIANLAQVLRTPLVVLQGAIAGAGEGFAAAVAAAVARRITWRHQVEIVPTPLRESALLLGAGATALSHEFGIRL